MKYACSECTGRSLGTVRPAATRACPATCPPNTRCRRSSGLRPRKISSSICSRSSRSSNLPRVSLTAGPPQSSCSGPCFLLVRTGARRRCRAQRQYRGTVPVKPARPETGDAGKLLDAAGPLRRDVPERLVAEHHVCGHPGVPGDPAPPLPQCLDQRGISVGELVVAGGRLRTGGPGLPPSRPEPVEEPGRRAVTPAAGQPCQRPGQQDLLPRPG